MFEAVEGEFRVIAGGYIKPWVCATSLFCDEIGKELVEWSNGAAWVSRQQQQRLNRLQEAPDVLAIETHQRGDRGWREGIGYEDYGTQDRTEGGVVVGVVFDEG